MMKNERKEKIKLIIYFMLTLTVMIIIFRFSSQNAYESMKVSRSFLNETLVLFDRILPSGIACFLENYIRKIAHFTVYTCLGIFTSLTIKQLDCVYPNKIKIWILKSLP